MEDYWQVLFDKLQEQLRHPWRDTLTGTFMEFSNALKDELIRLARSYEFIDSRVKIALCVHERNQLILYVFIDGVPVVFQYVSKLNKRTLEAMIQDLKPYLEMSTVKRLPIEEMKKLRIKE